MEGIFDFQQTTDGDKEIIAKYASQIKHPNCYLEIGTWNGGSALIALQSVMPDIEVYTVDSYDRFMLKGSRIHFINKTSEEACKEWDEKPIEVLFIDGDHSMTREDFEMWEKFVVVGGIVIFHDYAPHSPDVKEDCHYIIENYKNYKRLAITEEMKAINTSIFQIKKVGN